MFIRCFRRFSTNGLSSHVESKAQVRARRHLVNTSLAAVAGCIVVYSIYSEANVSVVSHPTFEMAVDVLKDTGCFLHPSATKPGIVKLNGGMYYCRIYISSCQMM